MTLPPQRRRRADWPQDPKRCGHNTLDLLIVLPNRRTAAVAFTAMSKTTACVNASFALPIKVLRCCKHAQTIKAALHPETQALHLLRQRREVLEI